MVLGITKEDGQNFPPPLGFVVWHDIPTDTWHLEWKEAGSGKQDLSDRSLEPLLAWAWDNEASTPRKIGEAFGTLRTLGFIPPGLE